MSVLEVLLERWAAHGLVNERRWAPTFIEDVGTASAENVRSAALRRWIMANPGAAVQWLARETGVELNAKRLGVRREAPLDAENRVDLKAFDDDRAIYIEVKWASAPSDAQITTYCRTIGADSFLLVLSPVRHVVGQGHPLPRTVRRVDWSQLADVLAATSASDASVEGDLSRTVTRWRLLVEVVRCACNDDATTVAELQDVVHWIDGLDGAAGAGLADYPQLTRELILAELAEAVAVRNSPWRRCLTKRGANGDFQSDLCLPTQHDFWYPCDDYSWGMRVAIRLHAYPTFANIDVNVGTAVTPYLVGAKRDAWRIENPLRASRVFEHAAFVRRTLLASLRRSGVQSTMNPECGSWWKCAFSKSFDEHATVADIMAQANRLTSALAGFSADAA